MFTGIVQPTDLYYFYLDEPQPRQPTDLYYFYLDEPQPRQPTDLYYFYLDEPQPRYARLWLAAEPAVPDYPHYYHAILMFVHRIGLPLTIRLLFFQLDAMVQ